MMKHKLVAIKNQFPGEDKSSELEATLLRVVGGTSDQTDFEQLEKLLEKDRIERDVWGVNDTNRRDILRARIAILQQIYPEFVQIRQHRKIERLLIKELWRFYLPFAEWIVAQAAQKRGEPYLLLMNAANGAGKTTMTAFLLLLIEKGYGLKMVGFSVDDLIMSFEARKERYLKHPLLASRAPGNYEIYQLLHIVEDLKAGRPTKIPQFDKSLRGGKGDVKPEAEWIHVEGPVQVVILEGWNAGAIPLSERELQEPINDLERNEDPHGNWRVRLSNQLALDFSKVWPLFDALVMLEVPDWETVVRNRHLQEETLRKTLSDLEAAGGDTAGKRAMSPEEVDRLLAHFERWVRHTLETIPLIAELVFEMDGNQHFIDVIKNRKRATFYEYLESNGEYEGWIRILPWDQWKVMDQLRLTTLPEIPTEGRTAWFRLQTPFVVPLGYRPYVIQALKIKGLAAKDHRGKVRQTNLRPYFRNHRHIGFDERGNMKLVESKVDALFSMTYPRAKAEVENSELLIEKGVSATVPIKLHKIKNAQWDVVLEGSETELGISITGAPSLYPERLDLLYHSDLLTNPYKLEVFKSWFNFAPETTVTDHGRFICAAPLFTSLGETLYGFHEAGLFRQSGRLDNFGVIPTNRYDSRIQGIYLTDLDSSLPHCTLTLENRSLYLLRDLASVLYGIALISTERDHIDTSFENREYIVEYFREAIRGYFGHAGGPHFFDYLEQLTPYIYDLFAAAKIYHASVQGKLPDTTGLDYVEARRIARKQEWINRFEVFTQFIFFLRRLYAESDLVGKWPMLVDEASLLCDTAKITSKAHVEKMLTYHPKI